MPVTIARTAVLAILLAGSLHAPSLPADPPAVVPPLVGRVYWPERQIQASMADVATRATVTLIDTSTSNSLGSTISGPTGAFAIDAARGFVPRGGKLYYVEAYKGLSNNAVSRDAARVRTVVAFSGGWSSLTGGGGIVLTRGTTALAALMDLKALTDAQRAALMGRLAPTGTPPVLGDGGEAAVTQSEFRLAYGFVTTALTGNRDPIDSLIWKNGAPALRAGVGLSAPQLVDVVPNPAVQGEVVSVYGSDFDPALAGNSVDFGGVAATPSAVDIGRLVVTVPIGARTGNLTVTTWLGSGSIDLDVLPTIGGWFLGL
jgi:hypothetical protein